MKSNKYNNCFKVRRNSILALTNTLENNFILFKNFSKSSSEKSLKSLLILWIQYVADSNILKKIPLIIDKFIFFILNWFKDIFNIKSSIKLLTFKSIEQINSHKGYK